METFMAIWDPIIFFHYSCTYHTMMRLPLMQIKDIGGPSPSSTSTTSVSRLTHNMFLTTTTVCWTSEYPKEARSNLTQRLGASINVLNSFCQQYQILVLFRSSVKFWWRHWSCLAGPIWYLSRNNINLHYIHYYKKNHNFRNSLFSRVPLNGLMCK